MNSIEISDKQENIPNQQEIWNEIAEPWKTFRIHPLEEVKEFLQNVKQQDKILDLGCGSGRNFIKTNEKAEWHALDFSQNMLMHAKEYAKKLNINIETHKSDATTSLPFKDNFFDYAIFIATLHCIPEKQNRQKTLNELYRILKPKARALITVWDKNQERFKETSKETIIPWTKNNKKYPRYYYLYEKQELIDKLTKARFKIIKITDKENSEGFYSKKNIIVVVEKN